MNNVTAANTANPAAATPAPRSPVLGESLFALVVVVAVVVFAVVVVVTAVVVVVESAVVVVVSVAVVVVVVVVYSGFSATAATHTGGTIFSLSDVALITASPAFSSFTVTLPSESVTNSVGSPLTVITAPSTGSVTGL